MGQQQSDCKPQEPSQWKQTVESSQRNAILGDMALNISDPTRLFHMNQLSYDQLVNLIEAPVESEYLLEHMAKHLKMDKLICAMADLHRDHAMFSGVRQTEALLQSTVIHERVGLMDAIVLAMACQFLRGYWVEKDGKLEVETRIDPLVILKRQQARNLCVLRMIYTLPIQGVSLMLLALAMGVFLLSPRTKESLDEDVSEVYYLSVDLCNHLFESAQQPTSERALLEKTSSTEEERRLSLIHI